MQTFIYCRVTLHVSGVTAPIIRSTKNIPNFCHNLAPVTQYFIHIRYKFQSNTTVFLTKCSYGNMFRLYWVIIRPSKEQIQCINIYSAFWDPKRVWDPRMHYKYWNIGSVLWKAWWLLIRVQTCCRKNISIINCCVWLRFIPCMN